MPWKRGTEQTRTPGQVSPFYAHFQIQSLTLVDQADPSKGHKIRCLAASDRINSGRIHIRAEGWRFRRQGAPIMFQHGKDPRVGALSLGRWNQFAVQKGVGMIAEGVLDHFAEPDPRAAVIADVQAGRLTDVSVGHAPIKMEIGKEQGGAYLDIQETELGEISIVSVGMDAEATYELLAASAYGFEWQDDSGRPPQQQEGQMDRKLLIQLLNMGGARLKDDANDAEIAVAVQAMSQNASLGVRASEVLTAIGLDQTATLDAVKQTIASIRKPENFVSKADYDKLLVTQQAGEIDKIIAESKNIPEGQKEFGRTLLTQGLEQGIEKDKPGRKLFDTWYASLPALSTRSITGAGAGTPPANQGADDMHDEEVTPEDEEWCQIIGYFRDERDPATGKVKMKAVQRMAQMATISSADALSIMFGQPVQETKIDKAVRAQQLAHLRSQKQLNA
jgi:hypothetical protein